MKIKNFFGFSLWNETLSPNDEWMQSFDIKDDFSLNESGWMTIFSYLKKILEETKTNKNMGGCIHFTNKIPEFLSANEIETKFS